jgi:hypothetical protein
MNFLGVFEILEVLARDAEYFSQNLDIPVDL